MKIEVDFEEFEGFEAVGVAVPRIGDYYSLAPGHVPQFCGTNSHSCFYMIYRKAAVWRKATPVEILELMKDLKSHKMRVPCGSKTYSEIQDVRSMDPTSIKLDTTHTRGADYSYSEVEILVESK
jgi:hypothetical protein